MGPGWESPVSDRPRDPVEARRLLEMAQAVAQDVGTLSQNGQWARNEVVQRFHYVREAMVWDELTKMPIDRVRQITGGRLRLGPLEDHGIRSIADALRAGVMALLAVPGVGEATAPKVVAAAQRIAEEVRASIRFHIDLDPSNGGATALLIALWSWGQVRRDVQQFGATSARLATTLTAASAAAAPTAMSGVRRFFMSSRRKVEADAAFDNVAALVAEVDRLALRPVVARVRAAVTNPLTPQAVWADFARRSADYMGLLAGLVDLGEDVAAAEGFLPAEIVKRVNEQQLDDSRLRPDKNLRGYQAFGAKFALVQRRVIIGDEMGLGKTIQAIVAIAHLEAHGATHILVVCPASVVVNWQREITAWSVSRVMVMYGPDRDRLARRWRDNGGIGVTTFDSLASLSFVETKLDLLVVDEAHFVKNPSTQRTQGVRLLAGRSDRVLFLTGTPMENKVEEFRALVAHLRPEVALALSDRAGVAGPDHFRQTVAPVYLRRNQVDVLVELPPLVQVDEWEEFGAYDGGEYRRAVVAGNFMAMRRAAFATRRAEDSAKLSRLLEIVDEAVEDGQKVVVFTFFRDVVDAVVSALGGRAHGPITGSTASVARQRIVDDFSASRRPGVLVAQIGAGGTGLNIQAASVVILCEPQIKPSIEAQAIARVHRMGQVRTVQPDLHRLGLRWGVAAGQSFGRGDSGALIGSLGGCRGSLEG